MHYEIFQIPWGRYLAWVRVLLGLTALGCELFLSRHLTVVSGAVLGAYLLYGVSVAVRPPRSVGLGLLGLFADTVLFLVLAGQGVSHGLWFPSVFYLYLLAATLVAFSAREVLIVVAVCFVFSVVVQGPGDGSLVYLQRTVVVAGVLAGAFAVSKKHLKASLQQRGRELETARAQAQMARDEERQRIASDFHDGPLQSFISLQMRLEVVRKMLERDHNAGMQELAQLQNLALSQVRELRAYVRSMRPVETDGVSLVAAARRIAENFQKESGVPVTFVGSDTPDTIPQETCAEVLQMLREALHNVQKHAGASRVAVTMEQVGRVLEISVDDNGKGFQFSGCYNLDELDLLRLGPVSLKRRARSLNADLVVESRPGRGAGLKLRIPA